MRPGFYPKQAPTRAMARTALTMLLTGARTLDSFTPEALARSHNLPVREIEAMLADAKARRAGE